MLCVVLSGVTPGHADRPGLEHLRRPTALRAAQRPNRRQVGRGPSHDREDRGGATDSTVSRASTAAGGTRPPSPRGGGSVTPASKVLARQPSPGADGLAHLLATAFLDSAEWERQHLVAAGALILGARRRWLGPLVRAVLSGYPRQPSGARRELARLILAQPVFTTAVAKAARRGAPILPERFLLEPAGAPSSAPSLDPAPDRAPDAAGQGGPGPRGTDAADLAWLARELRLTPGELDWFADTRLWNRRAGDDALRHYRCVWRVRPGRVPRLLEVPGLRLRTVQRRVLDRILTPLPLHPAAHGFVPGRSARSNAAPHAGAEVVISLDLTAFFAHVTPGRVFGALRRAGYPEATAHTLTGLCTHSVPEAVLRAMPDGGTPADRFALLQALRAPHLPQGAPSSPALANLAVRRLDARLTGWAERAGGVYTRYADDLAFSGPADLRRRADAFVRGVERIVADEGYAVNRAKTRVRGAAVRQSVTGVVVNAHPNVTRAEHDRLKAILHNCRVHGVESQRRGHPAFREHVEGRIAWVCHLNRARGQGLREAFGRIDW